MTSLIRRFATRSLHIKSSLTSIGYFNKRFIATIGEAAPTWSASSVINNKFETLDLEDYRGRWVVLFFYPLDFTYVCPTEIVEFNDKAEAFRENDCEVIGASIDSQFSHLAWINTPRNKGGLGPMNIPLIADVNKTISTDYGCLLKDGVTCRATYIIDNNGIIRHIDLTDRPVGRNVDEVLRLVEALQFADKFGEVCPASWEPGNKTMKPDPVGKLEYFESVVKDQSGDVTGDLPV